MARVPVKQLLYYEAAKFLILAANLSATVAVESYV